MRRKISQGSVMKMKKIYIFTLICFALLCNTQAYANDKLRTKNKVCTHVFIKVGDLVFKVPKKPSLYIATGYNQKVPQPYCREEGAPPIEAQMFSFVEEFPRYTEPKASPHQLIAQIGVSYSPDNTPLVTPYHRVIKEIEKEDIKLEELPLVDSFYKYKFYYISKDIIQPLDGVPLTITGGGHYDISYTFRKGYFTGASGIPKNRMTLKDWPDFYEKLQAYMASLVIKE